MGLFSSDDDRPKEEKQADLDRYKSLQKAQNNYRSEEEDPTYRQLNEAQNEAMKNVPWHRR